MGRPSYVPHMSTLNEDHKTHEKGDINNRVNVFDHKECRFILNNFINWNIFSWDKSVYTNYPTTTNSYDT